MTYILGDLHKRKEMPYNKAADSVLQELYTKLEEDDTVIQLGDFFHTYKPFPAEYSESLYWLNKFNKKRIKFYIMAGNNAHEYHHIQKTYAISPLESVERVTTITDISILAVEDIKYLVIPWIPDEKIRKEGCKDLKEYIEKFLSDISGDIDYILYHYEDETVFMGGENHGIDFTFIEKMRPNITRIGGHIHLQSKNYIGTPYQTRFDEAGQTGRYYSINKDSYEEHSFKRYVNHLTVKFEDEVPKPEFDGQYLVLNVDNAPSMDAVYDKFKNENSFINNVRLKFNESRQLQTSDDLDSNLSIRKLLQEFISTNKVDRHTSEYLLSLF